MMSRGLSIVLALALFACKSHVAPDDADVPEAGTDDGPSTATHDVTIIVEPSDSASQLVSAIQAAKSSVHMTMYLLT